MDTDPLTTLAMTGAHTIVAAMATNAWESAQAAAARLFHRRGHALEAVEAQLAVMPPWWRRTRMQTASAGSWSGPGGGDWQRSCANTPRPKTT